MSDPELRTVSMAFEEDDAHFIAVVERTPETDQMTDEEIIKELRIWSDNRHLHPVDDK